MGGTASPQGRQLTAVTAHGRAGRTPWTTAGHSWAGVWVSCSVLRVYCECTTSVLRVYYECTNHFPLKHRVRGGGVKTSPQDFLHKTPSALPPGVFSGLPYQTVPNHTTTGTKTPATGIRSANTSCWPRKSAGSCDEQSSTSLTWQRDGWMCSTSRASST